MATKERIDQLTADKVDIEVMNAFDVGDGTFAVSVELSDQHGEIGRSYLLQVRFDGRQITFAILLQLENRMLSHTSRSAQDHVLLEVGGVTHFLQGASHTTARAPDPFFHRLFQLRDRTLFTYGEDGSVCRFDGRAWKLITPVVPSFLRAMHGLSIDTLYVAGDHGTLLHLRGDRWDQLPLDINRSIEAVHVSADGTISLGCEDGFCFQYGEGELAQLSGPDSDFMAISDFKGQRYWGDNDYGLYVQAGQTLKRFRALDFVYALEASDTKLVAAGWKEVFVFDGSEWSGFEFGFDGRLFANVIDMTKRYL